jgi:phosphatidylserine decarboxylase
LVLYAKYFAYITVFKINIFCLTPPRAMLIFQAFMTAPLAKRSPSFKIVFLAIDGTYYEAIMTQVSALVIL